MPSTEHGDGEYEYLHAWQEDHPPVHGQGWRSYRLDRILSVQVLNETFTPREPITITDDPETMPLDFFEVNARLQEENEALAESLKRQATPKHPRQDSNLRPSD
jgi:predicted DNA-binding transcriptional regulator YafY